MHHEEKQTRTTIYHQPEVEETCILCGKDEMTVHFKGKCVCENCLTYVKELD